MGGGQHRRPFSQKNMSHFVSDKDLKELDLGNGDWVKIPNRLSFGFVQKFGNLKDSNTEKMVEFLSRILKEWNFKDDEGNPVAVTPETILSLEVSISRKIVELATAHLFNYPKVESPQSGVPSTDTVLAM